MWGCKGRSAGQGREVVYLTECYRLGAFDLVHLTGASERGGLSELDAWGIPDERLGGVI